MIKRVLFLIFFVSFLLCPFSQVFAGSPEDAAFLKSINNQGDGPNFDRAIMLDDTADYTSCDTFECAEKVFNESVFKNEIGYVADQFGEPKRDWDMSGHSEVTAYVFGNARYYDDLSVEDFATTKKHVLHFDITSAVDALKKKEYAIDPSAASDKWEPDIYY